MIRDFKKQETTETRSIYRVKTKAAEGDTYPLSGFILPCIHIYQRISITGHVVEIETVESPRVDQVYIRTWQPEDTELEAIMVKGKLFAWPQDQEHECRVGKSLWDGTTDGVITSSSNVASVTATVKGFNDPLSITDVTNAKPIVVSCTNHKLATGDRIAITGVVGNEAANGGWFVTRIDTNKCSLDRSNGNGDYVEGGEIQVVDGTYIPGFSNDIASTSTIRNSGIHDQCIEADFDIRWAGNSSSSFQAAYFWGQIYPELEYVPTGQNLTWWGSIDFQIRKWKNTYDSFTATDLVDKNLDIYNTTGQTLTLSAASEINKTSPDHTSLIVVLIAKQGEKLFFKTWAQDGSLVALSPLGGTGLSEGKWWRLGAKTSSSNFNTPRVVPGGANVSPDNSHAWRRFGDSGATPTRPYQFIYDDLNWCYGAPPIQFGWGIVALADQNTAGKTGAQYRLEKRLELTMRVGRLCLNITEKTDSACPCYHSCFKFTFAGGVVSGTLGSSTYLERTELRLFRSTDPEYANNLSGGRTDVGPFASGWCNFATDFSTSYFGGFANTFLKRLAYLYVHKATRRAYLLINPGTNYSDGGPASYAQFAAIDFDFTGATFTRVHVADNAQIFSTVSVWTALSDPIFSSLSTGWVASDSVPSTVDLEYVNCDGTEADFVEDDWSSCSGSGKYNAAYVTGTSGPLKWVLSSSDCSPGCEVASDPTQASFIAAYGSPTSISSTLIVNCRPTINRPPVGANKTIATVIANPYTFSRSDFGFADSSDWSPDDFSGVYIYTETNLSPVTSGEVQLDGHQISDGTYVTVEQLDDGKLKFFSGPSAGARTVDQLMFRVRDNGGTDHDGIDTDTVYRRWTVPVRVNHAPQGKDGRVRCKQHSHYLFKSSDFGFSDPDDDPPDSLYRIRVVTNPTHGTLNVPAGADVVPTALLFTPAGNGYGDSQPDDEEHDEYASFTFRVIDDGGTTNSGINIDPVARTMKIDVVRFNKPPKGQHGSVKTRKNTDYVFKEADFGFTDPDDSPADEFAAVIIYSVGTRGSLTLRRSPVYKDQRITIDDIKTGKLIFTPLKDDYDSIKDTGHLYSGFYFGVQDDGGIANGGWDTDISPKIMQIEVSKK